jgi:hypothetical protein
VKHPASEQQHMHLGWPSGVAAKHPNGRVSMHSRRSDIIAAILEDAQRLVDVIAPKRPGGTTMVRPCDAKQQSNQATLLLSVLVLPSGTCKRKNHVKPELALHVLELQNNISVGTNSSGKKLPWLCMPCIVQRQSKACVCFEQSTFLSRTPITR